MMHTEIVKIRQQKIFNFALIRQMYFHQKLLSNEFSRCRRTDVSLGGFRHLPSFLLNFSLQYLAYLNKNC